MPTSIRCPAEVSDPTVHDQIKAAVGYARKHDMGIVMDLEAPFARIEFARRYPDEHQGVVQLREVKMKDFGEVDISVESPSFGNYGFYKKGFDSVDGSLLRVYSYFSGTDGME